MTQDTELLRRFADEGAEEAFAELVRRKVALVYAAALRQTGGDAHLAQDVTQGVFLALACRAARLKRHAVLTGWLYTTTRFVSAKAVRAQARWQRREQEANTMNLNLDADEPGWTELRPVIDEAMHGLGEKDRAAILLRYFEGRPFAEVGAALGLAENAARMRVDRALEKLRERLARTGITSTAAALGAALTQPVVAAPPGLAAMAARNAMAGVTVTGGVGMTGLVFMSVTKIAGGFAVVALAFLAGFWLHREPGLVTSPAVTPPRLLADLGRENVSLKDRIDQLEAERAVAMTEATQARAKAAQTEAQWRALQAVRAEEIKVQKQRAMLNNLRQISAARERYQLQNGRAPTAAELIGPSNLLKGLNPVDGEDYAKIDLSNGAVLSIASPDGVTVHYFTTPPPGSMRDGWSRAIQAYHAAHRGEDPPPARLRDALLPYFDNAKDAADYFEWFDALTTGKR